MHNDLGLWREVNPMKILMPDLTPAEAMAYKALVDFQGVPKLALIQGQDPAWLLALRR